MLGDFYGNVLIPPRVVEHSRVALGAANSVLDESSAKHRIKDLVVAVERTGRYHVGVQEAFRAAGFDVKPA